MMTLLSQRPFYLEEGQQHWVCATLASMTAAQKVGQLFLVMGNAFAREKLQSLAANGQVGGVLFRPVESGEMIRARYQALDGKAAIPLLKAANLEEGGSGGMQDGTLFGWPMLTAATDDVQTAERFGKVCAVEGRSIGINWTFSPVCDIDMNFRNPITNVRTYGSDPERVKTFAAAYMKAVQGCGMAACAKHFPGDGVDDRDQHLHPTCNSLSTEEWYATYGSIYQALIDQGLMSIMAAHITQPSLSMAENPSLNEDNCLPASLSRELLTGVLRGKLGFGGVIATDATIMGVKDIPLGKKVRELQPGQKQLVEIAKSVSRNAKVLIMDEPSAPLSVAEVDKLFDIVRSLKADGVTIIYISHRMEELFAISDRVSVMRDGRYIATKNTAETSADELIALMVGRELSQSYPQHQPMNGEEALRVENLCGNGDRSISFSIKRGEIVGMAGLVGAGRTELARMIIGADKLESGQIYVNGKPVAIHLPSQAIGHGIGMIPEDRKQHGCFLLKSIEWNCSISSLKHLSKKGVVNRQAEKKLAGEYKQRLDIKTPSMQQLVKNLSGGNQQKVVLAKTLAANSKIIIFDEPTRGIDVGAKQEIYKLMCDLAESGKAILMISSDMQELLGMSDRILVLCEGELRGELARQDFSQDRILALASGLQ